MAANLFESLRGESFIDHDDPQKTDSLRRSLLFEGRNENSIQLHIVGRK